ncbi:hypothetical protein U6A24_16715 [Aquimarina gracilis]|uniref:Lipoprotein n=1 Tax=Aquimarina gracilis TaxID=874422 RepID=A0ABU5ZZ64_9FLAO|nr:hypothetical protein [Aquimarina gracilis]MEB3347118.1 hypothetical protein [Aquimarina gracilis]
MYRILCSIVIFVFCSCKPASVTKETKNNIATENEIGKPKFTDIEDQSEDPGSMELVGSIADIIIEASLCDRKYRVAVKLKVKNVIRTGRFISKPLAANSEPVMGFVNFLAKTRKLENELAIGQEILVTARERMCIDQSQRSYEILGFKIIK